MAPIWGTPAALRTYPEMEPAPGRSAASTGSASAIPNNPSLNPSFPSITPNTSGDQAIRLLDGKGRRRIHRLLGDVVVHLDLNSIDPGIKTGGRERFLQGHLVADIAHLVRRFHGVNHRFVRSRINHVVFERRRGLVSLIVHAQIVDLHPEIHFLVALE